MQGFIKTSGISTNTIPFASSPIMTVGVIVSNEGVTADTGGKKVVKAGTPVYGDIYDRSKPFKVKATTPVQGLSETSSSESPAGVLLTDVNVTSGNNNGTMVIFGFINTDNLDSDVAALITDDVKTALDGKITFLNNK